MPPSADAHGALVRPTCDTRPAKASDGTSAPISVAALKLAGRSAEQCRDAGCSVPDLIHLCYNPWKKGEKKADWTPFEGRAIIAEGKFGVITEVRGEATEDIKVQYLDGTTNSVNTSGGYLATDWVERGMCRVLDWADEACYQDAPPPFPRILLPSTPGHWSRRDAVGRVIITDGLARMQPYVAGEGLRRDAVGRVIITDGLARMQPYVAGGGLCIERAWYGGPPGHCGKVRDISEHAPWLWQTGTKKGKDVTSIVQGWLRSDGALDFNPQQNGCNDIFRFGHTWSCCKILAIEYRYGSGPLKTWLSHSEGFEPYSCFLPSEDGGPGSPHVNVALSGIPERDKTTLKALVVQHAASRAGWAGVDSSEVELKECSGHGGGKTFKVTRAGGAPGAEAFALHVYRVGTAGCAHDPAGGSQKQRFAARGSAASAALWAANLAPERVAEVIDEGQGMWYLDVWSGTKPSPGNSGDLAARIGRCLAQVHAVPATWFEAHRAATILEFPKMADVAEGSAAWYLASRPCWLNVDKPDWALKFFAEWEVKPVTEAGRRVVTAHTDIHEGNVIETPDGALKVIDLESTSVMWAIFDLSYCMRMWGHVTAKDKKSRLAMCQAYLQEAGLPHGPDECFALALDAERCTLSCSHNSPLHRIWDLIGEDGLEERLSAYESKFHLAKAALHDKSLAEAIVSQGLLRVVEQMESAWTGEDTMQLGRAVAVHTLKADAIPNDTKFALNGDGTIRPAGTGNPGNTRVLGLDHSGSVILTSCCNAERRLVVSAASRAGFPVTGFAAPTSAPVPLVLAGVHKGKGLCWNNDYVAEHEGNRVGDVVLGPADRAVAVHFEPDGSIRLADCPEQAFDMQHGNLSWEGPHHQRRVVTYAYQDTQHQRFQLNADGTISPAGNNHQVLAMVSQAQIVELPITHAQTWKESRDQAEREAGGLATCEDLRRSGVTAGDGVDLWMPVARADGQEGDYCQIGNHPGRRKERYISHVDAYGMPTWHENNSEAPWRPGPSSETCKGIIYARAPVCAVRSKEAFAQDTVVYLADLAGVYVGDYPGFGTELVSISISGPTGTTITATKITGDWAVAAGEKTWVAEGQGKSLTERVLQGKANCGPHGWQGGHLTIQGPDAVDFTWDSWTTVNFHRVDGRRLELINREEASQVAEVLVFDFPADTGRRCADAPLLPEVEAGAPAAMRLCLDSHPGKGLVLAPFPVERAIGNAEAVQRYVEGGGVIPAYQLVLGPEEEAVEISADPAGHLFNLGQAAADKVLTLGLGLQGRLPEAPLPDATGPVALAAGGVLACLEEDDGGEVVTCRFFADDYIDEVYYNGVDMRDYSLGVPFLTAGPTGADKIKTLKFRPVAGGVLAIAANDNQPGTSAAFALRCDSTHPESKWNFVLSAENAATYARATGTHGATAGEEEDEYVGSIGGQGLRPESAVPHQDWVNNEFDDSAWESPTKCTCDHWPKKHRTLGTGTWYKQHKYVFYRISPHE